MGRANFIASKIFLKHLLLMGLSLKYLFSDTLKHYIIHQMSPDGKSFHIFLSKRYLIYDLIYEVIFTILG